jgi:hypothetical protein
MNAENTKNNKLAGQHRAGPTEKSAQRGQINTANWHFYFPVEKIVECEKVAQIRAIAAVFVAGRVGFREMVFDLLVDAKPSESWQCDLKIGCVKTEQKNILYSTHGKI